jgi:hypothetical protein
MNKKTSQKHSFHHTKKKKKMKKRPTMKMPKPASFLNCTKMQNGQPILSLLIKIPSLGYT